MPCPSVCVFLPLFDGRDWRICPQTNPLLLCFMSYQSVGERSRQHVMHKMVPLGHRSDVCEEERRRVLKFDSCFEAVLALDWLNTCRGGLAKTGKVFCSVMGDKQQRWKIAVDQIIGTFLLQSSFFSPVTCVSLPWIMTLLSSWIMYRATLEFTFRLLILAGEESRWWMDGWIRSVSGDSVPLSSSGVVVQDDFSSGASTSGWKANGYIRDLSVWIGPTKSMQINSWMSFTHFIGFVCLF